MGMVIGWFASAAATYQYLRVYITANDGSALYNGMSSLQLRDAGGTDRAFGLLESSYTASSSLFSGVGPHQAGDADNASRWLTSTNAVPAWIAIDLGAQYAVKDYSIRSSQDEAGTAPSAWELQGNNTSPGAGEAWATVHAVSSSSGWSLGETRTFSV